MKDYLDLTDDAFNTFFQRLNNYLAQKCAGSNPAWTHIPAPERTKLGNLYITWYDAYGNCKVPHSSMETEIKNEAKTAAKAAIRPFVNRYLREDCPEVTNADRIYLGIPNKDTEPTQHPVPDMAPAAEAVPSGTRKHTIRAINPVTGKTKKPPLVKGVAFAHRVRAMSAPVSDADDMPSIFRAKPSLDFQYTESQIGMVCDYAVAYENTGAKRGPWSNVVSLIIT